MKDFQGGSRSGGHNPIFGTKDSSWSIKNNELVKMIFFLLFVYLKKNLHDHPTGSAKQLSISYQLFEDSVD